ncbi:hypothetical protein Leryth_015975 [Lithospermum erythrorhizon]|nr:hypothetical protein Leryth_015975 [Lithospermum erythrorhizon]
MNKFNSTEEVSQSTRLNVGNANENPEILGISEELQRKSSGANNSSKDPSELSKTKRHHPKELFDNTSNTNSPRKPKPRNPRRRISKEASENTNSNRRSD